MDSDSEHEGPPIIMRRMHFHAIRLHPVFEDCLLGKLTLDARWV